MPNTDVSTAFDYTFVDAVARVALYDDLKSAPRITEIAPAATNDYIEHLATTVYEQSRLAGGKVPYTAIREVSENFIHAQFREIVVSILDDGNTIRFADQGPGISEKEKAQQPGFTSATEPMKSFIRGVGSGLPIVREYLEDREGSIVIEDNLNSGAVVTISLVPQREKKEAPSPQPVPAALIPKIPLNDRQQTFLKILLHEEELGVTEISTLTGIGVSSAYNTFQKLEESGLVESLPNKKRILTQIGRQVALSL